MAFCSPYKVQFLKERILPLSTATPQLSIPGEMKTLFKDQGTGRAIEASREEARK
jgi:hypothetical protein